MMYGSTKCAMEYAQRGAIDEWIQLFLRNDGKNIALADGLNMDFKVSSFTFFPFAIHDGHFPYYPQ
jgi:hypothetical protein